MRRIRRPKITMCYNVKTKATKPELEKRFDAKINDAIFPQEKLFAFDNPEVPVITNEDPGLIQLFKWGLIPEGHRSPDTIRQSTNNARYDELLEKPSYRDVVQQKCLITVTGFYEYYHAPGGGKQLYLMTLKNNAPFSIGGLWSIWTDPVSGKETKTFTMLTIDAQRIMREIHNNGQRQPLLLPKHYEKKWLQVPYNPAEEYPTLDLVATKYGKEPQPNLFGDLI